MRLVCRTSMNSVESQAGLARGIFRDRGKMASLLLRSKVIPAGRENETK